ncbi:16S rRNA processing protein RimM [Enterobacteriaceae endosymbiont of Plateumaris consimilis]|uniref:ribosome maturation factor RimM n=1 Tax=Enterobacteriaceae endosymbiont of Plateumaris consimilis TaxID=2675794 RepID=UPI00144A1A8B|nr:ribosome maturation factor RimM [Enterobacteriaceae endosymbiont of Plateumaris consimilis]QJC28806.1 16S rRNA processing protein RimM [Enterobacteriaceae endosymbiont of Plateumaris consimilis]
MNIVLGQFGSVYGIKGYIKLFSYTFIKSNIFVYKNLFIINNETKIFPIIFKKWIFNNNYYIVKIINFNERNDLIKLVNYKIYILYNYLIKYKNIDEYYWNDIIGCKIINVNNYKNLGIVKDIISTGSNDVLIIESVAISKNKKNIKKQLIPFIENQVIKNINLIKNVIEVDWNFNIY